MSNAQHTPGPWYYVGDKTLAAGNNGKHIACIDEAPGLGKEAVYNKRLIAAAPELLEALRQCEEELQLWSSGINHRQLNKAKVGAKYFAAARARAAIAKVTA